LILAFTVIQKLYLFMKQAVESKEKKDMPVYTYRCDSCGIQFERQQSFQDAPLKTCPECRKKSVKRVITPSKVIFKGSGFYSTDHRSPSGDKSSSENGSHKSHKEHSHDHDHGHSHGEESKPAEKSSKSETSE
jgi:putative FmdB family regulatory protein